MLGSNSNIQECLLYIGSKCKLVSPESCHLIEAHGSEGWSRVQTIVEAWSMMLTRCVMDYAEFSSVLIKPDNFSVR